MVESHELVTVVVSVYNLETLLPRCLECISAQTYRNLEILLIDDGSTDGSGRLCDEFAASDARVRSIRQEHRGVWTVRNRGLEEAEGEYVAFIDGDDCFHKDYIRLLYEAINKDGKEYAMSMCEYRRFRVDERIVESDIEPSFEVMGQTDLLTKTICYPSCQDPLWGANWNKLYRKSVLDRPFQREYSRCQDFDSNLRLFFHIDQVVFVRKVLYYYIVWKGQVTASSDDNQVRNECRSRIFLDHFLSVPDHLSAFKPELMANLYRRIIVWREGSRGKPGWKEVSRKTRQLEKKTYPYFLTCNNFSIRRKLRWFLSLHAPCLLRLCGMKVTLERV